MIRTRHLIAVLACFTIASALAASLCPAAATTTTTTTVDGGAIAPSQVVPNGTVHEHPWRVRYVAADGSDVTPTTFYGWAWFAGIQVMVENATPGTGATYEGIITAWSSVYTYQYNGSHYTVLVSMKYTWGNGSTTMSSPTMTVVNGTGYMSAGMVQTDYIIPVTQAIVGQNISIWGGNFTIIEKTQTMILVRGEVFKLSNNMTVIEYYIFDGSGVLAGNYFYTENNNLSGGIGPAGIAGSLPSAMFKWGWTGSWMGGFDPSWFLGSNVLGTPGTITMTILGIASIVSLRLAWLSRKGRVRVKDVD